MLPFETPLPLSDPSAEPTKGAPSGPDMVWSCTGSGAAIGAEGDPSGIKSEVAVRDFLWLGCSELPSSAGAGVTLGDCDVCGRDKQRVQQAISRGPTAQADSTLATFCDLDRFSDLGGAGRRGPWVKTKSGSPELQQQRATASSVFQLGLSNPASTHLLTLRMEMPIVAGSKGSQVLTILVNSVAG